MSYMAKTEVYSWRVDRATKAALEEAARERRASVATVLDEIVEEWLSRRENGSDADEQRRLHEAASRCVGAIEGGDARRAERSRELVRERLRRRRAGT
ncbi:MAG TPA: hypothetical protein VF100_13985 [Thermoanaerobaculia bacterium]